jgi:uncharacterized protein YggE
MRARPSLDAIALVLIAAAIAFPAVARADQPRTIVVSGSGQVSASPDTADLSFAIETHAKTASEAASHNATLARKITDALKAKLGDRGRVWTGGYSLTPDYDQRPTRQGNPVIIGYNAQNSIMVETGAMDLLGELVDTAIAAGANRVNYLNFSLKDDGKARARAIADASRDAQAQAQALAASLNVRLKRLMSASTEAQPRPVPVMRAMAFSAAESAAPTPIEAGQVTVPASVSLTYEIE